jgi:hypothetical protein
VLGFENFEDGGETFGFVLVGLGGGDGGGVDGGEAFDFGVGLVVGSLSGGELSAEVLKGDLEVPVLLFVLLC